MDYLNTNFFQILPSQLKPKTLLQISIYLEKLMFATFVHFWKDNVAKCENYIVNNSSYPPPPSGKLEGGVKKKKLGKSQIRCRVSVQHETLQVSQMSVKSLFICNVTNNTH